MKWHEGPIKSICEGIFDGPHATPKESESGPVFLGIGNVTEDGRLNLTDIRHVSEQEFPKWTRRVTPRENDVVFSYEATLHRYALIPNEFRGCLGRRMGLVRLNPELADPRYMLYYFLSPKWRAVIEGNIVSGATVDRIPLKNFPKFPVRIHPIEQQGRIADVLQRYDALIENNRRRIALLEQAARLLYEEWFVRFRFPGHEHAKFINGLPVGWGSKKLSEKAVAVMGQSPPSKFYNEAGVGLPFHQGVKDYGDRFPVHRVYCSQVARLAEPGDILFSVRAPVGRINISRDRIVIGRGLAALRARDGRQTMLFHQLRAHFYKEDMIGTGAIYAAVTKGDLFGVKLVSPPDTLVSEFEEKASALDRQVDVLTAQNAKLADTRDLLLPRLMSGEVEV